MSVASLADILAGLRKLVTKTNMITIHTAGRTALLRCNAPLSGGPDPITLLAQIERSGVRGVLLDTSDVSCSWADSDGLRWLLDLHRTLQTHGHSLRIVAPVGGRVRRNIALLQTDLPLFASVKAAWQH
jgi:hypothetical protein